MLFYSSFDLVLGFQLILRHFLRHCYAMKTEATEGSTGDQFSSTKTYPSELYQKVLDVRKRPIRGLFAASGGAAIVSWPRLTIEDASGRKKMVRTRLEGAETVPQAQKALAKLLRSVIGTSCPFLNAPLSWPSTSKPTSPTTLNCPMPSAPLPSPRNVAR